MLLTDPVRTVVDLGLVLPRWSVKDALSRGITIRLFAVGQVQALREALGRQGRNGTGIIGAILEERFLTKGDEESHLEARLHPRARRHQPPPLTIPPEVVTAGRLVAPV